MDPDKKWKRYTKVGDVWVNMTKYRERLFPVDNGCVEYRGASHRQGYSMIGVLDEYGTRKMTVTHRIAMRMKLNRALTSDDDVLHTCDNKLCVNPAHLKLRNEEYRNDSKPITIPEISTFAK